MHPLSGWLFSSKNPNHWKRQEYPEIRQKALGLGRYGRMVLFRSCYEAQLLGNTTSSITENLQNFFPNSLIDWLIDCRIKYRTLRIAVGLWAKNSKAITKNNGLNKWEFEYKQHYIATASYTLVLYGVRDRRSLYDDFLLNIGHIADLLTTQLDVRFTELTHWINCQLTDRRLTGRGLL